jgi:cytochrome c oxidase subunit 2
VPSVALATAAVAGCLPAAVTAEGREIGNLYAGFVVIAILIGVLVFGLATFAIVRYRVRGGLDDARHRVDRPHADRPHPDHERDADPLPAQTRGNFKLEALWTGLPIATVLVLFGFTLLVLNRVEARAEQPGAELRVEAFRWGWTFRYPAEGIAVSGIGAPGPEVFVPVGEPIRITVTAADVNHAFFVPQFLFKRDAIPGRENVFDITIDEPGAYGGQCAEFCGIYHARMPFTIRAVPRAEYETWLTEQPRDGAEASVPVGSLDASASTAPSATPSGAGQPLESAP